MNNYCKIRHNISGRLRIKLQNSNFDENSLAQIMNFIKGQNGIIFVRINPLCQNLIINYQNNKISAQKIIKLINQVAQKIIDLNFLKIEPTKCDAKCSCKKVSEQKSPVPAATYRFLGLSAVMTGVFVKNRVFGSVVSQSLVSPLGIITSLSCLPLFYDSYKKLKQKSISLEAFLGFGCMASILSGQAMTALEILWINSGAELLTAWVTERSRKSIANILQVTSHHTFKLIDGVEVETKVSDLQKGDIVVLHSGEKVCVDGEIIDGKAYIDESPITGRSDYVPKSIGDQVLAGTFICQGIVYICAENVGDQTYLSRILCQVEDSISNKAPLQSSADKLAKNMISLGMVATLGTYIVTNDLWRAFTVSLIMACPCATSLSANTAISAALSAAAKRNILIKGGRYLEEVGKADCICFDKTGTLTDSSIALRKIFLSKNFDNYINLLSSYTEEKNSPKKHNAEDLLLQLVLSTEMHNHHPLAQAIKQEAMARNIEPMAHTRCEYYLGMGMMADINGHHVLVGNRKLLQQHEIELSDAEILEAEKSLVQRGRTLLFVALDNEIIGLLSFYNSIRSEAKNVIDILKHKGVKDVALITGDEVNTVKNISNKLGITKHYSSVLPEDKAKIIEKLQKKYNTVLMVGDGINDAMALSKADIGIAMGAAGSEVAVEAADITLINDNLYGLVYVHALSKQTVRVVHQNFWIAFSSNMLGLALGASGLMSPFMAGMFHIFHTLGVLANSSRLLAYEVEYIPEPQICELDENEIIDPYTKNIKEINPIIKGS